MGAARNKKGRPKSFEPARESDAAGGSDFRLGFLQADDALALLPLAALLEQFNALETLEHIALHGDAFGGLQAVVLGHGVNWAEGCHFCEGPGVEVPRPHDKYFSDTC